MKERILKILVPVAIVLFAIIFSDWLKDFIITSLGGYTQKETKIEYKEKLVKGDIDTTAVFNHYVETKGIVLNPKPIIKYITKYDTIRDTIRTTKLKEFNIQIKDSLIEGNMNVKNYFNGDLFEAGFTYKPLFPKYITRVDTLFINRTETNYLSRERARFGIGIGHDLKSNNWQVLGSYTNKKGWQIIGEIEFVNSVNPINLQNSNGTSIKLIKNF